MRTYGRSFAEFLNEESPVRLRLLDVPTCFGFSTVAANLTLEAFLERWLGGIGSSVEKPFPIFWISPTEIGAPSGFAERASLTP